MDTEEIKQNEYYKILDEIMRIATVKHMFHIETTSL